MIFLTMGKFVVKLLSSDADVQNITVACIYLFVLRQERMGDDGNSEKVFFCVFFWGGGRGDLAKQNK